MIINIKGKNFRGYNETDNNLELIFTFTIPDAKIERLLSF